MTEAVGVIEFVLVTSKNVQGEDPIHYRCETCGKLILAEDTDRHASRTHKAHTQRVFHTETGFQTWKAEQKLRAAHV